MTAFAQTRWEMTLPSGIKKIFILQLKSCNHKLIETSVRVPHDFLYLETDIISILKKKFSRGAFWATLTIQRDANKDIINEKIEERFKKGFATLQKLQTLSSDFTISMNTVISFFQHMPHDDHIDEELSTEYIKKNIIEHINQCCILLEEQMAREGNEICILLENYINTIESIYDKIVTLIPLLDYERDERLKKIITKAKDIVSVENQSYEPYVIEIFKILEKNGVAEELDRFKIHLIHCKTLIRQNGKDKGKHLEFIILEMNREINTLNAKSNNIDITNYTIEIKRIIEKIREQIQNIM
jgi:uncharacterized protein (TIGR00255 family)